MMRMANEPTLLHHLHLHMAWRYIPDGLLLSSPLMSTFNLIPQLAGLAPLFSGSWLQAEALLRFAREYTRVSGTSFHLSNYLDNSIPSPKFSVQQSAFCHLIYRCPIWCKQQPFFI